MTNREAMYEHHIQTVYAKHLMETTPQQTLREWVDTHVPVEEMFNDRQDVIDDLELRIKTLTDELEQSRKSMEDLIDMATVIYNNFNTMLKTMIATRRDP